MRYNHRYHQRNHGSKQHRRYRLGSFALLAVSFAVLTLLLKTRIDERQLLFDFSLSLWRVSLAYVICLVLAVVIGLITVSYAKVESLLLPVLDVAQSFPSFALLPLLVVSFGHSSVSVIAILLVAMIWPIVFAVIGGVKEQRQDQAEAAQVFGATGWKFLAYYRLPMLRPSILTGSIVSWGQAWDTIVGAEIIAGVVGAGSLLGSLGQTGQTSRLALAIVAYLFLIFCLNQLIWLPLLQRATKYQAES